MNGNRGQYTSAPLFNMKKKRMTPKPAQQPGEGERPAEQPAERHYVVLPLILCVGLPILFLAALIVPSNLLRWVYLGAAAASLIAMWALRAFVKSARGTLTVIYCALALVIGLALYMNGQSPETRNVSSARVDTASVFTNSDPSALGAALASYYTPAPEENANSAAAAASVSAAQQQLNGFMQAWALGNVPQMLDYVLPSWKAQQTSAETALWQLTLDSRPVGEYQIESTLGSDGDSARTIVIKVHMNERNAGSELVYKRMQVLMFRTGQTWYVDPNSLNGLIIDEATEQAAAGVPMIGTTIAPTATPAPETATSGITLYYNPNGGKYYHSKATCEAVNQEYWPLTGFSYDLLNSAQFSKLIPCTKCNPPARNMGH